MKVKTLSFILLFVLINALFAHGLDISILVSQKDIDVDSIRNTTREIENGIFEVLFDKGYIVSNEPITIIQDTTEEYEKGFDAAITGYVDYYVHVQLFYDITSSKNPGGVLLSDIKKVLLTIVQVDTNKEIFRNEITVPGVNSAEQEEAGVKAFSREIGNKINIIIKEVK
jgi:hypothetical protein